MKKLLFIINAPSPYRWHTFNVLRRLGLEKGIDFQVAFMSGKSKAHPWSIENLPPAEFPYETTWGFSIQPSRMAYINPGFILKMLFTKWDWVIFGGYDMPTNILLIALPLLRTKIKLIRNEGNIFSPTIEQGPIWQLKRFLLRRCDGYLIPGKRGLEWLSKVQPSFQEKYMHSFLNAINDEYFANEAHQLQSKRHELRKKWNIPHSKRVFVSPARLSPEKGLAEFIEKLPSSFANQNIWIIAGDGPERNTVEASIIENNQELSVRLLGYIDKDLIPELYALADIFVLPSLRDQNPLSAIEAAFSGLPLLMSIYAGNSPELVIEGVTGWTFDPLDAKNMKSALQKALQVSDDQIKNIGLASFRNASERFRSEDTCSKLLDFLLEIHPDAN